MTAQEYYNPASNLPPGENQRPHVHFPNSYSTPPPEYQSFPQPTFLQQPSASSQQQLQHYPPPPPQNGDMNYGWQPEQPHHRHSPSPQPPHHRPTLSSLQTQPPPQNYHQRPQYQPSPNSYPAHLRPQRSYSEPPSPSTSGDDYPADRRHESRHSHHHTTAHRHHPHEPSNAQIARGLPRSHDSTNTFLGAFGGGAIGDLIFPGLGTIGGALLGGFGGRQAGRRRSFDNGERRGRKRDRYDEEWEEGRRRRGEVGRDDY